ncbi:MAG TPA: D-2-hydroxyacid dehydrogenase [Actinomycetota bacterium]|nr:D-2-hydroxyacid dehydrogenase [Actinomycetota bacterium]
MSDAPARVVVMGATLDDPPPGIGVIADAVDLAFADELAGLAAALPGSDVLFAWRPRGTMLSEAWEHAGDLRWIQSASAGVDALLFPELVRSHVVVTNARGVFDDAIAEYVLGVILLFSKGLAGVLEAQRRREWRHRETERLEHKRVLVAGAGPIGRAIARGCAAMGMQVRGVGRTARPRDGEFGRVFAAEDLAEAAGWADYVVNALPATAETRRRFDAAVFAAMSPGARFINVGRGSTVDEGALIRALEQGRIGGAALDVFEEEPLPAESPLWAMPNVVVSPHMAGDFAGWRESAVELFVGNLERYLTGRPLQNVVDKDRGYVPS